MLQDIVALTQEVRAFKEALGKLRRLFHAAPAAASADRGQFTELLPSFSLASPVNDQCE